MTLDEGNTTRKLTEEYLAIRFNTRKCRSSNCVDELKQMKISSVHMVPPTVPSTSRASEAGPTAVDTPLVLVATWTAPMAGGGAYLALGSLPKPTGGSS